MLKVEVKCESLSSAQLLGLAWTVGHQAPLFMEFSREEYWREVDIPFSRESSWWQEYTEELYKKDLHDPDNHDGAITLLEPDILEWAVNWALGSITTNKASGGDGIPVELFQILRDDVTKVRH